MSQGSDDTFEQLPQGEGAETFASVRESAVVGFRFDAGRMQMSPNEGQRAVAKEGLSDDKPNDAVGREASLAMRGSMG